MIAFTPRRTRKLLQIRRILTAKQRANRPDWPDETITELVTNDMKEIGKLPNRKVRMLASHLEAGN